MGETVTLLTGIPNIQLMTGLANLSNDISRQIYNSKILPVNDWIKTREWDGSSPIKFSMDFSEIEYSHRYKLTSDLKGKFTNLARFISSYEEVDTSFPFNPPSIVTHADSQEYEIVADRVAGFFEGTNPLWGVNNTDTDCNNTFGVTSLGDYFGIKKILNNSISSITNSTINAPDSLVTPLKMLYYQKGYFEDHYGYTGNYNKYSGIGREKNRFSQLFDIFYTNGNDSPMSKANIKLTTNFLLFETEADCDYYLRTGDKSKAIDYSGATEGEEGEKYLYCITKENTAPIKDGQGVTSEHDIKLAYDKGIEGYGGSRPVAGYIVDSSPYNIKLKTNPDSKITKTQINVHDGSGWQEVEFDTVTNPDWTYTEIIQGAGGKYYFGILNTNIPIFETEQQVNDYFAGILSAGASLNGGGNYHGKGNGTGSKKDSSLFNNVFAPSVLSKCIIGSYAFLNEVAGVLFPEEITSLKELTEAMGMFGENPIQFISDLFMIPFNPRPFCQTASNNVMGFGSYYHSFANAFEEVVTTNTMLTMFNTFFDGSYSDWRDYMAQYFLYLPYVGVTAIDIDKYLYKQVECKVSFDVRTGSIKYYLLADGVMVDSYEGSVRVTMPLCGSDAYSSAMQKLGGASSVISGVVGAALSGASGNVAGTLSNAMGIAGGVNEIFKASPKSVSGNFSNSLAFNDQLDCYLIIAQQEYEYPDNLPSTYGLPDNDVNLIGSYSGYLECNVPL